MTHERDSGALDETPKGIGRPGALGGDNATVRAGDRERQRRAAPRSRIVGDERRADDGLGRDPVGQVGDPIRPVDLDPRRIDDRRCQRARQVVRNDACPGGVLHAIAMIGTGIRFRRGPARHRVEVEPKLELAGLGSSARPAGAPALGPAGDPCRRHVAALDDRPKRLRALLGGLAGHRWQPFDQCPELVLAEQTDDRVAIVVAEARGLEIDLDRKIADDPRQLTAHPDLVDVLPELVGELGRRDLIEAIEQGIEVPEIADQLRRGLLSDPGNARDVVARIALERLVVDHLVRPEPEPLIDLVDVVHDRVLDAGSGRHQADARRHELEHVEVDRDDRGHEVVPSVELLRDRPDDIVGLVALHLVDRDAQRLDDLADLRELVAQVVRHPDSGRFVLRICVVTEGRAWQVERDREVIRVEVLEAAEDDAREAERAVDEVAVFGGHEWSVPAAPARGRCRSGGSATPEARGEQQPDADHDGPSEQDVERPNWLARRPIDRTGRIAHGRARCCLVARAHGQRVGMDLARQRGSAGGRRRRWEDRARRTAGCGRRSTRAARGRDTDFERGPGRGDRAADRRVTGGGRRRSLLSALGCHADRRRSRGSGSGTRTGPELDLHVPDEEPDQAERDQSNAERPGEDRPG